jgi:hypothetical protein
VCGKWPNENPSSTGLAKADQNGNKGSQLYAMRQRAVQLRCKILSNSRLFQKSPARNEIALIIDEQYCLTNRLARSQQTGCDRLID